jgi:hypothetical protein
MTALFLEKKVEEKKNMREAVKVDPYSNLPLNVQTPPIHFCGDPSPNFPQMDFSFSHDDLFSIGSMR